VFRGHYRHTIDTKGRLSIPSRFRDALADGWGDRLVIVPNSKGLDVYPLKTWEELEARVAALPSLDRDVRQFRYTYLSLGQDVLLDPQGRIQVSSDYRERAGLEKDVLIIGMQKMFEVWNAERWAHFQRDQAGTLDELQTRLAAKGV
jgi:transcriptional regulator MraZ